MSKSTDSLLNFSDFENFDESQESPVSPPKKAGNDGEKIYFFFVCLQRFDDVLIVSRSDARLEEGFAVPDRVLSAVLQH